ncbi:DUF2334 domain-containing protein [Lysinibacillus cavernae]|uniref:DUF2334 domain-containing protein n=1 Tax=Lysinibacillus cavernae TaxID=2666135 RepID=UPI0012D8DD3F|nr:DUF2334 domain-containing protein [Lysinibacillus cavernae]
MRSKYSFWLAIGLLCFYTFVKSETVHAAEAEKDIALIFATSTQQPNNDVRALQEILQVYTSVDVFSIEEVNQQMLQPYKRMVVLNTYPTNIPQNASSAVDQFQGPAVMIGENALQFSPFSKWQVGPIVELRAIGEEGLNSPVQWKSVKPSVDYEVVKMASSLNQSYPFIMKKHNWSYIGDFINSDTMQYQWPAIIGELLQLPKPQIHPAFIVLTDINMKTDVQTLQEVVMEFSEKRIPIALEVTPILLDESENKSYYLHDNKKLLSYLQKLQKEGYPFILSSAISTEKSLNYLVLRKIIPTINRGDSSLFKGNIQQGDQQLYLSQLEHHTIYPMTVGTIVDRDIYPLYPVKQKIDLLLKVPRSVIGIQYPAYLNATYVKGLVDYLSEHPQIELFNFRQTKQQVKSENISIVQHENGEQTIHLSFSKIERLKILFDERPFELILWVLVLIVSMFVTLFFISTLRLRITLRKRLFEERKTNG